MPECEISVSKLLSFETCPFFVWYRHRYRFWKILVSKKVLVSVTKNFGIGKSIGIGFEKLVGAFWQVGVLSRVQLKYLGMMLMGVKLTT